MMPKGKPKTKFFDLYSNEDVADAQRRQMAPQAAPHARGGRWQVPDHAKTGTHWDDMHYVDLKKASEEAGLYQRDMGKLEMIRLLATKDRLDEYERHATERELQRKRKEAVAWERKKQIETIMKKQDRKRRREADEDYVSDTTEEELEIFNDETDESSSTCATTPATQSTERTSPTQRLKIYEWPHGVLPLSKLPLLIVSPKCILRKTEPEPRPIKLPYAVMKLVTIYSDEKVELPGRQHHDEVGPDFVSSLSQHTKDCARNGVMYGRLKNAIIERGAHWAKRTLVQSWNGRMYFHLPPRGKSKKTLADVYAKWRKKNEISYFKLKKAGTSKDQPNQKAAERLKNERRKMLDVFAVSEYRPLLCYEPSCLDCPLIDNEWADKSIDNLFYIRFPDMDLPHYYFWASPGEWKDPTKPNPEWLETEADTEHNQSTQPQSSAFTKIMVKRTPVPCKFRPSATPPKTSPYKAALCAFEKDLYHKGLSKTLKECRERWMEQGKTRQWTHFIKNLPAIYPAANLPSSPPINPPSYILSLAEKIATVEVFGDQHPVQPIMGEEPWTRDDAAYWRAIHVPDDTNERLQDTLLRSRYTSTWHEIDALERRASDIDSSIQDVSLHAHSPITPPLRHPSTPCTDQREWENMLLSKFSIDNTLNNTIDSLSVAADPSKGRDIAVSPGISALCAVPRTKKRKTSERIRELEAAVEGSEILASLAKRKKLSILSPPVKIERRDAHAEDVELVSPKLLLSSKRQCLSAQQPSAPEVFLSKIPQKRRRIQDANYRYTIPSSPSSGSHSPIVILKKRKKHANVDSTYRVCQEPSSPSTVDERPLKKHKCTKKGRAKNLKPGIVGMPHSQKFAPIDGLKDIYPTAKMQDESARSGSDTQSTSVASSETLGLGDSEQHRQRFTKRQRLPKPCCTLMRKSSAAGTCREESTYFSRPLSATESNDSCEGTPSPSPKPHKTRGPTPVQKKPQTPKQAALAFKKATEATNLAARRHARKNKKTTSTIKPLILTRSNFKNNNPPPSSTTSTTNSLVDFLEPATPTPTASPDLRLNHYHNYHSVTSIASGCLFDYSSDSEVSVSLILPVVRDLSTTAYANTGECKGHEGKERVLDHVQVYEGFVERKHSFDVEGSEIRELVPPNTPV